MPTQTIHGFDSIHIIETLKPNDRPTGQILFDELRPIALTSRPQVACYLSRVQTREEFLELLRSIARDAQLNDHSPILQIEAHGSPDGVWVASGEFLRWIEFKPELTAINKASRLNLVVMLAACEGANLVQLLQPVDRAPFLAMIGPKRIIKAGELERATLEFYQTLFCSGDAAVAWRAMNKAITTKETTFAIFTAEFSLRYIVYHYLQTFCTEEDLTTRQNEIELKAAQSGISQSEIERRREQLRRFQRDHRNHFAKIKTHFLFCDLYPENNTRFGVTYDDCLIDPSAE